YIIKARVTLLRDIGAAMSPFNAWMFIQGLETVTLRIRQHCANASAVAAYLAQHPKVARVIFAGMQTGEAKRRTDAYLNGGHGGLVGFELKAGKEAGRKFIEALKMFYHVANIGDVRSLAIHPATTTHSQLSPEEQLQTEYRKIAERRVRLGLVLAEIGRENNVQVTEQELTQAARTEAMRYGPQAQQMHADLNYEYPIRAGVPINKTIASYGALTADAVPLTQIAANRKKASTLVDKVGFDN
ncbi:MAG: PLP-dependent transferase, partial [Hyphomicrobiales bacterium]